MICTTIQNRNLEQIYEALEQCEMAEIRLDRCSLTAAEIDELFTSDVPLVATCRIAEIAAAEPSLQDLAEQSREIKAMQIAERRLVRAIEAGARYVDVELEAPKQMSKRVRQAAHENGTVFIRSYHDFEGTDSLEALKAIVEKCVYHGADMVKIVTTAHSEADVRKVNALYEWCREEAANGNDRIGALADGGLVAFCMGEAGRSSRLVCLKYGSPYTYAALSAEEAAAPGQWPAEEMRRALYGDFPFIGTARRNATETLAVPHFSWVPGAIYNENCTRCIMPVSKSFAQRAIIAAALAEGTSHLRGYTQCGDNEAAIQVARNLGAEVVADGNMLTVKGISACLGSVGIETLHVGESGLLTRMMIPLMAQLAAGQVTFTGEKTLLGRPLTGARAIMEAFGAGIANLTDNDMAQDQREDASARVPLTVTGPLQAGRAEISGKHGSQLISGLLMALPFAGRNSSLIVHEPKSIPYMFITLEVLKKFGIKVGNDMLGGRDFLESDGDWSLCTEMVFKVKGGQKYKAADIDLEGDWSAAANFLVAGAIFGKAELQGLDTTSLQADLSIMDILMDAGASLSQLDGDKGNITVQRAPLKAFSVDASNCPDLFPIISVLAAFCQGTSRIAGVGRLANKESDRAKAILEMLTQMGVKAAVEADELVVEGHSLAQRLLGSSVIPNTPSLTPNTPPVIPSAPSVIPSEVEESPLPSLLHGGSYTSHHDHRMVMALKVAELGADSPITIDDEDCVSKSFPHFIATFKELTESNKS
ncbi:MAG: type I 3-dehydroquinate dehydratase [Bacteroidales bacterium]|nr:type I 3-dehydroquinate dehydratase [Bacteroidales bacterium]